MKVSFTTTAFDLSTVLKRFQRPSKPQSKVKSGQQNQSRKTLEKRP